MVYTGWKFTHDLNTVNFHSLDFVAIIQNYYITNILGFLSTPGEKNIDKSHEIWLL